MFLDNVFRNDKLTSPTDMFDAYDEYGISKEEFEEMIGGEIVDEDEESDEEATEEDADKEDKSEDSEDEDKPEDDIDPAELFKGL